MIALAAATAVAALPIVEQAWDPAEGFLRIGPEPSRLIPRSERGHALVLPDGPRPPTGVVLLLEARRVDPAPALADPVSLHRIALARNVGVLQISTGNPLDFLFEDSEVETLARRIETVLRAHGAADVPLFATGLSLGGTRALRLAGWLARHPGRTSLDLDAVAVVDAPLDMERLWEAERRAAARDAHPAAADEGRWVTYLLEENLGGPPSAARDAYVRYSPYSRSEPGGGAAALLADLPLRAYHEPDVDWWIENRRKSYYSMNSLDLAALVNELKLAGARHAELVTTWREREGWERGSSPHTASIVDDVELVEWFLSHAD